MALEPAKLSDFRIAGTIGAGTTSRVYEAVHLATGRPVAIKTLEPTHSDSEIRERFAREAVLLGSVDSRHVGKILGFGFDQGQPFLVLERLVGETLDARLRRDGPIPAPLAVRWIEQLLAGVRDCHAQQVIHRDIKPSNIFLHRDGAEETVKLIDFGVARLREINGEVGGITATNHLIGSMGYMAPEQFRDAKTVSFTADLYAVGVVVFRTLTGRLPFVSRSLEAVIRMKSEQVAPLVSSSMPGMPEHAQLDWWVCKAMACNSGERFQTAREMLEQWRGVTAGLDLHEIERTIPTERAQLTREVAATERRPARGEPEGQAPISVPVPTDPEAPVSVPFPIEAEAPDSAPFPTDAEAPVSVPFPIEAEVPESVPIPIDTVPLHDSPPLSFSEERTMLRARRAPIAQAPLAAPTPAPESRPDVSPQTERRPYSRPPEGRDPSAPPRTPNWDLPTKTDPGLRDVIDRELELYRKRKGTP